MINLLLYAIGAAVVGILHMSAPDHWLTLCVLARNKQWARKKLFRVSFATAIGHVILSVAMGLVLVVVGVVFSNLISSYLNTGIAVIMIVVGIIVGIRSLVRKSVHHQDHVHDDHDHDGKEKKNNKSLTHGIGYFSVLGATLSPDPSITPIFLSAIPSGFYFALELSLVFAVASILTLLLLVQLGAVGLAKTFEKISEKYSDSLIGFVIAAVGIYILVAG